MPTDLLRSALIVVSLGACVSAVGCSDSHFNKSVDGVVTLNGKPVPSVRVTFVPIVKEGMFAPSSAGVTDVNGNFTMTADNRKKGAAIAKHKVVIVQGRAITRSREDDVERPETLNEIGEKLPPEYSDLSRTPLEIEVTPDKHRYEFQLTSRAP
jgi:hypothetical protein